ncbi:MAG TPA: phospholipid carrier-dependent glycosyltransferase, partial [Allocoleopsis sp.]
MINFSKYFDSENKPNIPWFPLGIMGIFLFSLTVRFWGLSRFNTLVFDEVHFAKFANNYLVHQRFFENHPPLGKYFIAVGIWLTKLLHIGGETNNLTGSPLTPFSYRWMNALIGSFIPIVISAIAYQLTNSRFYSLIAGLLMCLDGLFLVESRYALINIYLIIFG